MAIRLRLKDVPAYLHELLDTALESNCEIFYRYNEEDDIWSVKIEPCPIKITHPYDYHLLLTDFIADDPAYISFEITSDGHVEACFIDQKELDSYAVPADVKPVMYGVFDDDTDVINISKKEDV